jgi:hypothetical protein
MTGWEIFGLVVAGVIVFGVVVNAHDIARYFRIRSM